MSKNLDNNIKKVCKHKAGDDEHSHRDGCCTDEASAESSSFEPHHQIKDNQVKDKAITYAT